MLFETAEEVQLAGTGTVPFSPPFTQQSNDNHPLAYKSLHSCKILRKATTTKKKNHHETKYTERTSTNKSNETYRCCIYHDIWETTWNRQKRDQCCQQNPTRHRNSSPSLLGFGTARIYMGRVHTGRRNIFIGENGTIICSREIRKGLHCHNQQTNTHTWKSEI